MGLGRHEDESIKTDYYYYYIFGELRVNYPFKRTCNAKV